MQNFYLSLETDKLSLVQVMVSSWFQVRLNLLSACKRVFPSIPPFVMCVDLEKEDNSLQDIFKCHQGPVYEVVTVESEPNTFLSVGEDGTARWFDLRATKNCPSLRCKAV